MVGCPVRFVVRRSWYKARDNILVTYVGHTRLSNRHTDTNAGAEPTAAAEANAADTEADRGRWVVSDVRGAQQGQAGRLIASTDAETRAAAVGGATLLMVTCTA